MIKLSHKQCLQFNSKIRPSKVLHILEDMISKLSKVLTMKIKNIQMMVFIGWKLILIFIGESEFINLKLTI